MDSEFYKTERQHKLFDDLFEIIKNSDQNQDWKFSVNARDYFVCRLCQRDRYCYKSLTAFRLDSIDNVIERNKLKSFKSASKCRDLWDIKTAITLCGECLDQVLDNRTLLNNISETPTSINCVIKPILLQH